VKFLDLFSDSLGEMEIVEMKEIVDEKDDYTISVEYGGKQYRIPSRCKHGYIFS